MGGSAIRRSFELAGSSRARVWGLESRLSGPGSSVQGLGSRGSGSTVDGRRSTGLVPSSV
eukprot:31326-Rhodomonas_salina.1